jgi:hypothetical protein
MIYIMLSKKYSELQRNIISFIKDNIKNNNFQYKIIFNEKHIFESDLINIDNSKDIVLWHPNIASDNLELVKSFLNSIIILDKPSLYIQKISEWNPINENLAINNGFFIIYINPSTTDITNDEWKLVVQSDMYLMSIETLLELINKDESNICQEKIIVEDIFESITDIIKNQINLS